MPSAAEPGEYLTGIVLQNAEATSGDASAPSGMELKQIVRQIVAVSIDVPGPRTPALGVGAMTHRTVADRSTVAVEVHNLGNVRLKPTGEFVLWDSTGKEVTRFPITMDTVYAHTDTYVEIPFSERLNPGDYAAELRLTDASGLAATSSNLLLNIPEAEADTTPQVIGAPPSLAQTNQTPLPPARVDEPSTRGASAGSAEPGAHRATCANQSLADCARRVRRGHGRDAHRGRRGVHALSPPAQRCGPPWRQ